MIQTEAGDMDMSHSYKDLWDMLEILVIVLRKRELDYLLTQPENLTIILPGDNLVVCKSDRNDQLLFLVIFFITLQIKPLKY